MTHPSRREILRSSLGLLSFAFAPIVLSADEGQERGWRDLTQEELDAAYSQGPWAPNLRDVLQRYSRNSELARSRLGEPRTFSYGDTEAETLDVYPATGTSEGSAAAPVHVYIRGGAWVTGHTRDYAFLAENFVNAGAHFIAVNYASVNDTDARLMPLADQVRRALAWIYRNAVSLNVDPERIYLSGHSAGAHLAGVAMTTDWAGTFGLPARLVKGGLLCSGMFDLEPVSRSSRREYVHFDDPTIQDLSPQRHLDRLNAPIVVAYGTLESPEFQRQSRDFVVAVRAAGKPVDRVVAEHYNHFEVIETLASPYGVLGRAALRQMGLG